MSVAERITAMAAEARATGKTLQIFDVRYATAGIPDEITETYLFYRNPIEVLETGKLGSAPENCERGTPKMLFVAALLFVEIIEPPKGVK